MADSKSQLSANSNLHLKTKDLHGSDNSIPLSPQWLYPKGGDGKSGTAPGDISRSFPINRTDPFKGGKDTSYPIAISRTESFKGGNSEEHGETDKKKEFWRSTNQEIDSRDHWRDEERENSANRRWREDFSSHSRSDRWGDGLGRSPGESRRMHDRWVDVGNRESGYDSRRESKWDTRWGREDADNRKESVGDASKDPEREADNSISRVWRPNTSQNRARVDLPHNSSHAPAPVPPKQAPGFGYMRSRNDGSNGGFGAGRGRSNFGTASTYGHSSGSGQGHSNYTSIGAPPERRETNNAHSEVRKYSRAKLLDIYRQLNLKERMSRIPDGLSEILLLTQLESLEPLALSAPSQEEEAVLQGIDRGDIVSSGATQFTKECPGIRNRDEMIRTRSLRTGGSREDLTIPHDLYKDEISSDTKSEYSRYQDAFSEKHADYPQTVMKGEGQERRALDEGYINEEVHYKHSDDQLRLAKDINAGMRPPAIGSELTGSLSERLEMASGISLPKFEGRDGASIRQGRIEQYNDAMQYNQNHLGQHSFVDGNRINSLERNMEGRRPEDLRLYYRDPQGQIQGPFLGSDMINWFEQGFFGIDLPVRLSSAPPNSPFVALGDVMPHLKLKTGPPPGFGSSRPTDALDTLQKSSSFGSYAIPLNDHQSIQGGSHGLQGLNAADPSSIGFESKLNMGYPAQQRLAPYPQIERGNSLPSYLPYSWQGRDAATLAPSRDSVLDYPVNESIEMQRFQFPQQRMPQQFPGLMPNLASQTLENFTGGLTLEQLLAAGVTQDVAINIIKQQQHQQQQQFLLSQFKLSSQSPVQSQAVLEQLALLRQKQQQEQEAVSAAILEQLSQQRIPEYPFERHQTAPGLGTSSDHLSFRPGDAFAVNNIMAHHQMSPAHGSSLDTLMNFRSQQLPSGGNFSQQQALVESVGQRLPSFLQQEVSLEPVKNLTDAWEDSGTRLAKDSVLPSYEQPEKEVIVPETSHAVVVSDDVLHGAQDKFEESPIEQSFDDAAGELFQIAPNKSDPVVSVLSEQSRDSSSQIVQKNDSTAAIDVEDVSNNIQETKELPAATEARQSKKGSEKKTKKQKSQKAANERPKSHSEAPSSQQVNPEHDSEKQSTELQKQKDTESSVLKSSTVPQSSSARDSVPQSVQVTSSGDSTVTQTTSGVESIWGSTVSSVQASQAWKSALPPKPKSLLEIMEQEQQQQKSEIGRAPQDAAVSVPPSIPPNAGVNPWSEVVGGASEVKPVRAIQQDANSATSSVNMDGVSVARSKRSALHDLFAEQATAKMVQQTTQPASDFNNDKSSSVATTVAQTTDISFDDSDFVEAKDTKKNRKKGSKGKNVPNKGPVVGSLESSPAPVALDKSRAKAASLQPEKELLPAPPSGPSLADFLPWKSETATSPPAPAWSSNASKVVKATSLREIQKQQERKHSYQQQMHHAQQSHNLPPPKQASRSLSGNSSTFQQLTSSDAASQSGSSNYNVKSSSSSHSRSKTEENEYFWGAPVNHTKQDYERPDFPSLSGKQTSKGATGKMPGSASKILSSSPTTSNKFSELSSSSKAKKQTTNKLNEAKGFYDWCEAQLLRLMGDNDTNFIEYCMKQPRSEAEALLVENLIRYDPKREFIDEVLKYKQFLSADVIELAFSFRGSSNHVVHANVGHQEAKKSLADARSSLEADSLVADNEFEVTGKGGRKKGKKGKKVNPASLLGFNVESTRILKGEIQGYED